MDGKINPHGLLTRAQMAAIIGRTFGATEKADLNSFSDVPADAWYHSDMARAVEMGVFQGASGKPNPEPPISRQEIFQVLARAFLLEAPGTAVYERYNDAVDVTTWAKDAVAALEENGYVNGSGGKLAPAGLITCAEFAQLMSDLVEPTIRRPERWTATSCCGRTSRSRRAGLSTAT